MFQWYKKTRVCYAYMGDVRSREQGAPADDTSMSEFCASRWFTRGWTVQELIAPDELLFFDKSWNLLNDRQNLGHTINEITGIPCEFLSTLRLNTAGVVQRMFAYRHLQP
ncbi:hypothetical protein GQ53DRAFT_405287 [Thozetella sp. PMI_491]|nr:hypothetical protein GQ53DRAFT_405287 [Thozetella sp. PMI_491]